MEIHTDSWPPLDQGLTPASGDVEITQPQDQPQHAALSLDQQAADILKLFGEMNDDSASTSDMEFDSLAFEDPVFAQLGAMSSETSNSDPISSISNSSTPSSTYDATTAQQPFQWPTLCRPPSFDHEETTLQPGALWVTEPHFDHSAALTRYGGNALGIHLPAPASTTSVPVMGGNEGGYYDGQPSIATVDEFGRQHFAGTWHSTPQHATMASAIMRDDREDQAAEPADPCYAQLLYKCLRGAPQYTLSLRELYEWVAQHSQKARDPTNRGWQNSVRHNLSMNAAFQRVTDRSNSTKKGSLWRLTDQALRDGVISTTRYRKDPKRKAVRSGSPAASRQASGSKGGQATRDASRLRQQLQQNQERLYGIPGDIHARHFTRRYHGHPHPHNPAYSVRSTPQSPQTFPHYSSHGLPVSAPTSSPASPYFDVHQPGEDMNVHIPGYHQTTPEDFQPAFKSPTLNGFGFLTVDHSQAGLFGDHDPELVNANPDTPTPSLMTEASFMTDDHLISCGPTSREGTIF